jgi:single-strand DNA-binding protein
MSGSLNKVLLIGNLGNDPELKATPGGQHVALFSVATTETWRTQQGEKQSRTEWHNIVLWGKQAELAGRYLRKGKQVLIEGRIQYRDYTDRAGVKKTACEIRCDSFVMLGGGGTAGERDGGAPVDAHAGDDGWGDDGAWS